MPSNVLICERREILLMTSLFQILSRSKPAADGRTGTGSGSGKKQFPELEDFIIKRDYTGALTLLEVRRRIIKNRSEGKRSKGRVGTYLLDRMVY